MQILTILLNFTYAIIGGFITIFFMWFGYRLFDRVTHFDTSEALEKDNRAVGMVYMGIFIGVGIATGLVIGMGLN